MIMTASGRRNVRNYEIDFIKLILIGFVFIYHTLEFKNENTTLGDHFFLNGLGWISVHFFFVISGFLMMKSHSRNMKTELPQQSGRNALRFVFGKFRGIASHYYTSLAIALGIYLVTISDQLSLKKLISLMYNFLPELFLLNRAGLDSLYINLPTWYIQAMLVCMLPMYYLLSRSRDTFRNVIAPLGMIFFLGFMFRQEVVFMNNGGTEHIIPNGMIRGFAGLFSGCAGYILYEKLTEYDYTKAQRIMFTVLEVLLYGAVLVGCFMPYTDTKGHFMAMLLIPPAVALTFSGASNIGNLFRSPKLSILSSLSTIIYFNHWSARRIILTYMPGMSWKRSALYMAAVTVILCIVCAVLMKLCRIIWRKWLRRLFSFRLINKEV